MGSPLIQVRGLRYCYPDGTHALHGIDFDLSEGETAILFGPNGSGKTSFLLHLNGLLRGSGIIQVCGHAVSDKTVSEIRRKVGIVFQDTDDQLFMPTVLADVAFALTARGQSESQAYGAARQVLQQLGLDGIEDRLPMHLSLGQKRRVAIAGVLVTQPQVLIFDEPTTFLDPPSQRRLVNVLRALPQAKIIATHDAWLARELGTKAYFFRDGKLAGQGAVEDILREFDWDVASSAD